MDLTGRRVVISGSSRGLGFAFAEALGAGGARVVINGVDAERCEAAATHLRAAGIDAVGVPGPVQDEAVADRLVETCVSRFGGIDLAVNNAGVTRDRTLTRMTGDEFDEVVAVHLRGAWALSRAAARAMKVTGGQILNVVSGSALFGLVGQSNYAAAKGGMLAMTRALSVELAPRSIRVNALYPVALTDMTRPVVELARSRDAEPPPFGDAAEVAAVVAFLASPAADTITGQLIHFDGRELSIWSHPAPMAAERREEPWSPDDVAAFFAATPSPLEPLHPDRWGGATRRS